MKDMAKGKEHSDNSVNWILCCFKSGYIADDVLYMKNTELQWVRWIFFFCEDLVLHSDDMLSSSSSTWRQKGTLKLKIYI